MARQARFTLAGLCLLPLVALSINGCPSVQPLNDVADSPEDESGRPNAPQIIVLEEAELSPGADTLTLPTGSEPQPGSILVSTHEGGFLREVDSVVTNSDGSLSVTTSSVTIAEAVQDGDFQFTDGPMTAKQRATAKTWQVLTFSADLDRTLYDRNGLTVQTDGDFSFDVTLDLDIQVRHARIRYFRSAIEGNASLELDGDIDALGSLTAETGDVTLWSASQYLYGYIGVFPAGLPVVVEVKAGLLAGAGFEATGQGNLVTGISADSGIRLGAEYDIDSGWSGISDQSLGFWHDSPVWCLQGEMGARVYVRPTVEVMFFTVAGPYFDVEPYLEYTASAFTCGGGGQQPYGAYDWELCAGAAAHAKVKVDILDLYMIESPTLTVFDVRRTLASGHGDDPIDSDGDGVPDDEDGCPDDPNKTSPGNCGCGNPETPGCGAQPPGTPSGPTPADGATDVSIQADLDWGDTAGADSYDIYFGTDPTPDAGEFQGSTGTSSWSLSTLDYGVTYYWQVVAKNSVGETSGLVWSFAAQDEPIEPPAEPSSPDPADGEVHVAVHTNLDWADSNGATSYDVYFGTDSTPDAGEFQGNTATSSWALSLLDHSTTYYWRIVARNDAGYTPGPIWSFDTEAESQQLPEAPENPAPANGVTGVAVDIDLDWSDAAWADSYDVYFGTDSTPDAGEFQGNTATSSWALSLLDHSTTYYWQVVAKNDAGCTAGPVWTFHTQEEQPTDGAIVAWGRNDSGQCDVPAPNSDFVTVAAGDSHSLGLKSDGWIVAWGWNGYGQCDVPAPNSGFVGIATGHAHSVGLKFDGSIVAWGLNDGGECDVPAPNSDFVTVAAGGEHSLGLKADGSIVAWGWNYYGQCDIPAPNSGFVAVAAGRHFSLGLKADGSIVAWGRNDYGQCNVPAPNSNFVGVAAGQFHSLGLKADGSIVAWGDPLYGQCDLPAPNSDFIAMAGGGYHSLGLKADGSIVAWGWDYYGQCDIPAPNSGFVAVAAGRYFSLGLKQDGPLEPPAEPSSPNPADSETNVALDAHLDWSDSAGAISYDVYFGTDPTPDAGEFQGSTGTSSWSLSTLDYGVTYYWQVVAKNSVGETLGPIWSFTTQAEPLIQMVVVTVGNPGNTGELSGEGAGGWGPDRVCGSVEYTYDIGKYEVTAGQYTVFLNAVAATDNYGLYNPGMWTNEHGCKIERSGSPGYYVYSVAPDRASRPVNFVSWGDAARFANWLHNSQPTGTQDLTTTEDGSYFLNGATSDAELMTITREPNATWVIPSEDEWYKAAYHKNDGATGNYWDYPTGSDAAPGYVNDSGHLSGTGMAFVQGGTDPGNYATYNGDAGIFGIGSPHYHTLVGEWENSNSPYGTYDQGGNVWEWTDALISSYRVLRGGSLVLDDGVRASCRTYDFPTDEYNDIGFRVSTAPLAPSGVVIDTVVVGNPGNTGELSGEGAGGYGPNRICGVVDYAYNISKYEVTAGQYTVFLNAVADNDTYGLYNPIMWSSSRGCKIKRSGVPGSYTYNVAADWANRPVNYVSWGDAARFANWLHNGQPTGVQDLTTTEDGSYFLNGATSNAELLAIARQPDATWVIPSEDEWYKAAYHKNDGATGNYWDFPTSSDSAPSNDLIDPDPGNNATFWDTGYTLGSPYWRTEVGAHENSGSPYGTLDQGGNVWEWNEAVVWSYRGLRGGSFPNDDYRLRAPYRDGGYPSGENDIFGFRVCEID